MPGNVRLRLVLTAVLLVVFVLADGWLDRAEVRWAQYAAELLFLAFFASVIAVSWPWITRFWQRTTSDESPRAAAADALVSRHWRLAFLVALFTLLAAPLLFILVTWTLKSISMARLGVPVLLLAVLTLYAVAYRPSLQVVPRYTMGSAVLLLVAFLIWSAVMGVLNGQGASPMSGAPLSSVPIAWMLLPLALMVFNVLRGTSRSNSSN